MQQLEESIVSKLLNSTPQNWKCCLCFCSTELVTSSGDVIRASENEDPELFWGMKGCGFNFG